ncbi:MAG TPA: exopolysaccharide biosynthesis polyprenyl glycosylphosphotransferase, partial [Methylobacterium sp.]
MFQERLPERYERLPVAAGRRRDVWAALLPRRRRAAFRLGISMAVATADLLTIVGTAYAVEIAYNYTVVGQFLPNGPSASLQLFALVALIVLLTNLVREEYSIENQLSYRPHLRRTATLWMVAWAVVLVVGFATKTTHDFSRVVSIGFFVVGLPAMLLVRLMMVGLVRRAITTDSASVNRVHLVGFEEDIVRFYARNDPQELGLRVIGTSYLRRVEPGADAAARHAQMSEDLDLAVSVVRFLRPDDVFILVPWVDASDIERC